MHYHFHSHRYLFFFGGRLWSIDLPREVQLSIQWAHCKSLSTHHSEAFISQEIPLAFLFWNGARQNCLLQKESFLWVWGCPQIAEMKLIKNRQGGVLYKRLFHGYNQNGEAITTAFRCFGWSNAKNRKKKSPTLGSIWNSFWTFNRLSRKIKS